MARRPRSRGSRLVLVAFLAASAAMVPAPASGGVALPTFVKDFAGPGLADMYPTDVEATATQYVVMDTGRYRVVKVNRATGAIVDQAGGAQGRGNGVFGAARSLALDSAGNVFVADTANNRVQKLNANLDFVTKWGKWGKTAGLFAQPYGIAVGMGKGAGGVADEVVYVTDNSGRIQKFERDGDYLGTLSTTVNKPRMLAVHPDTNDLYVISAADKEVVVINQNGGFRFSWGGIGSEPGKFRRDPRGIAIDAAGKVYVTDLGNGRIQVFDSDGNYLSEFGRKGGAPERFTDPRGLDVTADGKVIVTDLWDYAMDEFQANGTWIRELFGGAPPEDGFNTPRGIDASGTGRIAAVDWWNQRVHRYDADGSNHIVWGFRGTRRQPGSINFAWGVAVQPGTGRVFVANRESHEIEVFTPNGDFLTRWGNRGGGNGQFRFPHGVAFAPNGDLLVTDSSNHRIQRFSIDGGGDGTFVTKYGSFGAKGSAAGKFRIPTGIAVASDGTMWVADTRNDRIQRLVPGSGWTAFTVPGGGTKYKLPWGIAIDQDGYVWVADSGNDRIVVVDAAGVQELAFTGPQVGAGGFNRPFDLAFGPSGQIWISDTWNNRIVELAA